MSYLDEREERHRIQAFYSQQMDGELEKLALHAYELSEIARDALRRELDQRGLTPDFVLTPPEKPKKTTQPMPGDPPPAPPPESQAVDGELELRTLVTIRKFRDLPEALLAKCSLQSAGIDAFLLDDNVVRMDWFWSNLLGGVKLQVDPENIDAANDILALSIPESLEVPGVGEYHQPRCPRCESLDVAFRELDKPVAYVTAYFSVPIPWHRRAWRCHSCKSEWEDDALAD